MNNSDSIRWIKARFSGEETEPLRQMEDSGKAEISLERV